VEHIDKHRRARRQLTAWRNKVMQPLPTSFEGYRDVFCRLGFPIGTSTFTSLFPPEGGNLNLLPAIIGPKRSWEQWIGIAPLSDYPSKTYPIENMEQVVKRLSADHPKARFFLFSHDNKGKQLFSCWVAQMPQCVEVWHHLENMQQELILMSHLDVMLSMDSAAMHLASLTATPVVSVWGATHPYAGLAGWGQQQENVLGIDMECRPCSLRGHKPCRRGDLACLNGIAEETIVEKVNQILLTHQK
jgi:ADP-heptose:LPS heptosyltransferase